MRDSPGQLAVARLNGEHEIQWQHDLVEDSVEDSKIVAPYGLLPRKDRSIPTRSVSEGVLHRFESRVY